MLVFTLSAIRALVEFLLLCLLARTALGVMTGSRRHTNAMYRLFELLTMPPRRLVARLLVANDPANRRVTTFTFLLLFVLWILLAYLRQRV